MEQKCNVLCCQSWRVFPLPEFQMQISSLGQFRCLLWKNVFPKSSRVTKNRKELLYEYSTTCIKAWLLWAFAWILNHCFKQSPRISVDRRQMCNGRPLLKFTDVPRLHFLHGVWPLIIKIPWTFWYTWTWKLHLKIDYRPCEILFTSDWPSISAFF